MVITSSRGLCGGYNGNVLRTAGEHFRGLEESGERVELHMVGKKGVNYLKFAGWPMAREMTDIEEESGFEYLRQQAVGRIYMDNIRSIQSSWVTQGLGIGQLALKFGANDMGSIMIEENVVAAAGARNHVSTAEMKRLIRDAGYEPVQRLTLYQGFVDEATQKRVDREAGAVVG